MSFIRVSLRHSKDKIDINTAHLVSFKPLFADGKEVATELTLLNDDKYSVNESSRQIRSFIKKAQGTLPQASATE